MPLELAASDPKLRRAYLKFNRDYFGGKLTEDVVLWFEPLSWCAECGTGDDARGRKHGLTKGEKGEFYIVVDQAMRYSRTRWKLDLLHEMVHVALWPYNQHGRPFQAEMLRLAQAGAFKKLW